MLNNDDGTVREMARASLLLDLRRRKVPLAAADQNNFLGFRRKDSWESELTSQELQGLVSMIGQISTTSARHRTGVDS